MAEDLVVDSGIIAKWFVTESDSEDAVKIYHRFQNGDFRILVPGLVFAEFGNIIWKKRIYQNLSKETADIAVELFQEIAFLVTPSRSLFNSALLLSIKHKRSFYDSLYLALSLEEDCKFVTADEKLYNSVRNDFPKITLLSNWPK